MIENIIEEEGEILLSVVLAAQNSSQDGGKNLCFLQCCFFQLGLKPEKDILDNFSLSADSDISCTAYFCSDGDIIFEWKDGEYNDYILESLKALIKQRYKNNIERVMDDDAFFIEYDALIAQTDLKRECIKKQGKVTKSSQELLKYMQNPQLIATFKKTMHIISMQRMMRVNPHILIVEDQIFSQKILLSALKDYTCHVSSSTGEAIVTYIEKCPDIVLLDIDLPDLSGHKFANFLNQIDSQTYIVMVTSNTYTKDIKQAKENNVKGFIPKPYKKDVILDILGKFKKHRKKANG